MNVFLSRFNDSLLFNDTKTLFFFNEDEKENNPAFKNPKPISNYFTSLSNYQKNYKSHIIHNLHISNTPADYKTVHDNIVAHVNLLRSQISHLETQFLSEEPEIKNKEEFELFMEGYNDCLADVEKTLECLMSQEEVLEKKFRWDLLLVRLKLKDSYYKPILMEDLEKVCKAKIYFKALKMAVQIKKEVQDRKLLGLKQVISGEEVDSPSSFRILNRFSLGNSSITLRFRELSRDGK